MSAIQIPRIQAHALLRPMSSGRTMPCLMLCKDEGGSDLEVIVKWKGSKELGLRGLVCELMTANAGR